MSTTTINIDVKDNGSTAKATTEMLKLKKAADAASTSSASIGGAAARASVPSTSTSALANSTQMGMARAIGVGTGAAGRDFANQAAGLGGLVRVYATFAANIFAISTAFSALSRAADTTNMVKGLDQLGAVSGRNLGNLSKQLVIATDGAISLRDAMTATAQSSAGGMTNDSILRMANVAKQASQALGVAMPDAMSRLSRGITKLEPELLDEIGIMVRVDTASKNYARSIGKSVTALSDFEKRQGFANAVLEQGERKFGAIKIDANPYAKILASMENIAQVGLELTNKVLSPILTILSSSPTALAAAMAGIASILIRQALPAIGMFKEGMQQAADQAKLVAVARSVEAQKGYKAMAIAESAAAIAQANKNYNIAKDNAEAINEAKIAAVERTEAKMLTMSKNAGKNSAAGQILSKLFYTEEDLKRITKITESAEGKLAKLELMGNDPNRIARSAEKLVFYKEAQKSISEQIASEKNYVVQEKLAAIEKETTLARISAAEVSNAKAIQIQRKITNTDKQTEILANRALISSVGQSITAQAAQTGSVRGFTAAWKEARAEIRKAQSGPQTSMLDLGAKDIDANGVATARLESVTTPALNKMRGGWISLKAGISGATAALGTALNFLGPWMAAIGIASGLLIAFYSWMSKSAKESAAFSTSVDSLNSSFENVARTLDVIDKKSGIDLLTVEGIQAKATALNELSSSLNSVTKSFDKLQAAQSTIDKIWDGIKDLFGQGSGDVLSKSISNSIIDAFKLMEEGPAKEQAKKSIKELLKVDVDLAKFPSINDAIKDQDISKISALGKAVDSVFAKASLNANIAASNLTAFKNSLVEVGKQITIVTNSLIPTDELSKLGINLLAGASSLNKALSEPLNALTALKELASDTSTLSLLPPDLALQLGSAKNEIIGVSDALVRAKKEQVRANEALIKSEADFKSISSIPVKVVGRADLNTTASLSRRNTLGIFANTATSKDVAEKKYLAELSNQGVSSLEVSAKKLTDTYAGIEKSLFNAGLANLKIGLTKAMGEASISVVKSYATVLASIGGNTAKLDESLKKQQIQLQINEIKAKSSNTQALMTLTLGLERKYLQDERTELSYTKFRKNELSPGIDTSDIDKQLQSVEKRIAINDRAIEVMSKGDKGVLSLASKVGSSVGDETNRSALSTLGPLLNEIFGKQAQLTKLTAELQIAGYESGIATLKNKSDKLRKELDQDNKTNSIKLESLSKLKDVSGEYNSILQTETDTLEIIKIKNEFKKQELDLEEKINIVNFTAKAASDQKLKGSVEAVAVAKELNILLAKEAKSISDNKSSSLENYVSGALKTATVGQSQLAAIEKDRFNKLLGYAFEINKIEIENQISKLDTLKEIGGIEESIFVKEKALAYLNLQSIEYAKSLLEITKSRDAALESIRVKEVSLNIPGKNQFKDSIQSALDSDKTAANTEYLYAKESLDKLNVSKTDSIKLTEKLNVLNAVQTESLKLMSDIGASLTTVFEDVGTAIGDASKAMLTMVLRQEELNKKKEESLKLRPEDSYNIEAKFQKESLKNELTGYAASAGAAKKLFNEKSGAYKLLSGVEKAASAFRLALEIKELATKLGFITTEIAANTTKETIKKSQTLISSATEITTAAATSAGVVAASTPGIMASFFRSMGPWGWAAAAVAIAAIGGSMSGGGSDPKAGFAAEEQQAIQGTGRSYNGNGDLVNNGGGALGDSGAKSKAIENSIALIQEHTFNLLSFSNGKTYDALVAIRDNTQIFAKALGGTTGITGGLSAFGTQEGSSKGFLGFNSSSTEVKDTGIIIAGAIKELIQGGGTKQQYENVQNSSSSFFGLFNSSSSSTNSKGLKSTVTASVTNIFSSFKDTLVSLAESVGSEAQTVSNLLDGFNINIKTSGKGLTGAEFASAITEEIGIQLDIAAKQAFPALTRLSEQLQKFGESTSEFAIRLQNDARIVPLALSAVGLTMNKLAESGSAATAEMITNLNAAQVAADKAKEANVSTKVSTYTPSESQDIVIISEAFNPKLIEAQANAELRLAEARNNVDSANKGLTTNNLEAVQSLLTASGGLDAFLSKSEFYAQNFLSEAEKLVPVQAAVTKEMKRLGFESVTTKEQFVKLISSLDLTTELGVSTYSSLMNVAEGFSALIKTTEALLTEEELRKAKLAQQVTILTLQNKATEALTLSRAEELKQLDSRLQTDAIFINQLQDAAQLKLQEITIMEASGSTYELLMERRKLEYNALIDTLKPGQLRIYQLQNEAKTSSLNTALMNAEGRALDSLLESREKELRTLSKSDAAIQRKINNALDVAKTRGLMIELLGAQDKPQQALIANRVLEAKSLSETDLAIKNQIWALQDAKTASDAAKLATDAATAATEKQTAANKTATDAAYSILANAIDAKKAEIELSIDALTPVIDVLKNIFDTLKSAVAELYSTVDATVSMTLKSAKELINTYYKSNSVPTDDKSAKGLTDAIGIALKATDNNNFATLEDANREKLLLANRLNSLKGVVENQLSGAEQSLVYLKQQVKDLDKILTNAKTQLDALYGIDQSVMSIANAIDNLAIVISQSKTATAAVTGSNAVNTTAATAAATATYVPIKKPKAILSGDSINGTNGWVGTLTALNQLLRDNFDGSQAASKNIYDVLQSQGITAEIVSKALGTVSETQVNQWATDNGWPKFATGGDHAGGIRMVGEMGAELENTGPSRIFNANQTRKILQPDNTELIQEIRMLRLEVQSLKAISQTASNYNKTTSSQLTRWDVDGMPPTR